MVSYLLLLHEGYFMDEYTQDIKGVLHLIRAFPNFYLHLLITSLVN